MLALTGRWVEWHQTIAAAAKDNWISPMDDYHHQTPSTNISSVHDRNNSTSSDDHHQTPSSNISSVHDCNNSTSSSDRFSMLLVWYGSILSWRMSRGDTHHKNRQIRERETLLVGFQEIVLSSNKQSWQGQEESSWSWLTILFIIIIEPLKSTVCCIFYFRNQHINYIPPAVAHCAPVYSLASNNPESNWQYYSKYIL